jgi:hypothetical protein
MMKTSNKILIILTAFTLVVAVPVLYFLPRIVGKKWEYITRTATLPPIAFKHVMMQASGSVFLDTALKTNTIRYKREINDTANYFEILRDTLFIYEDDVVVMLKEVPKSFNSSLEREISISGAEWHPNKWTRTNTHTGKLTFNLAYCTVNLNSMQIDTVVVDANSALINFNVPINHLLGCATNSSNIYCEETKKMELQTRSSSVRVK